MPPRWGELIDYALLLILLMASAYSSRYGYSAAENDGGETGQRIRYNLFSQLLYTRWQELSLLHSGDMLRGLSRIVMMW